MKTENSQSESLWKKASVANLVRYEPSGIYFARAKVRGKLIRKSLDTNVLTVAKMRLADVLDTEQKAVAPSQTKIVGKMIFADALAIFKERQKLATDIKDTTKAYNARAAFDLLKTWSGLEEMDVKRITKFDCLEWRAKFGKMYSPTVTNGTLSVLRRVLDIAVDSGARYDNPAKDKDVKRARVRRKELQLPEPDQFLALVNKVRTAGSRDSDSRMSIPQMTVGLHCQHSAIFMPQPLCNGWNVHAGFDAPRGEQVSQIVMREMVKPQFLAGVF